MATWNIEIGTPADVDGMVWATSASQVAGWRTEAARRGVTMLVARDAGAVIGKLMADAGRAPGVLWLWMLSVDPAERGRGVGTGLLAAAAALARDRGQVALEGGVDDANPQARRLYERLGYRVVGPYLDHVRYVADDGEAVDRTEPGWHLRFDLR